MKSMALLLALFVTAPAFAQETTSPAKPASTPESTTAPTDEARERARIRDEMCATQACQRNIRVALKARDGSSFDKTFDVMPAVVQPFGMLVLAGQTVHVEAAVKDDRLTDLVQVASVVHPERTITVKFEQTENGMMMLSVSNPFPKPLKFHMGIMPLDHDRLLKTSSCPVVPGGHGFESWPYPIFQVALGDGHLLAADAEMACTD
jgi:hypothetical protein